MPTIQTKLFVRDQVAPKADYVPSILIKASELVLTPPEFIIDGLFERGSISMMYGPSHSGKTFVMLDAAMSIASGHDFYDHCVKEPSPVIYVAAEGLRGLHRRAIAWCQDREVEFRDIPFLIAKSSVSMSDGSAVQALTEDAKHFAKDAGNPSLIVFDTLNRSIAGWDENSNTDMAKLLKVAENLCSEFDCNVCLVHHTGHETKNRARGASALYAGLDQSFKVSQTADGIIHMENDKMKDGDPPKDLHFKLQDVTIETAEHIVKSACLIGVGAESAEQSTQKLSERQAQVVHYLDQKLSYNALDGKFCISKSDLVNGLHEQDPSWSKEAITKHYGRLPPLDGFENSEGVICRQFTGIKLADLSAVDFDIEQ